MALSVFTDFLCLNFSIETKIKISKFVFQFIKKRNGTLGTRIDVICFVKIQQKYLRSAEMCFYRSFQTVLFHNVLEIEVEDEKTSRITVNVK